MQNLYEGSHSIQDEYNVARASAESRYNGGHYDVYDADGNLVSNRQLRSLDVNDFPEKKIGISRDKNRRLAILRRSIVQAGKFQNLIDTSPNGVAIHTWVDSDANVNETIIGPGTVTMIIENCTSIARSLIAQGYGEKVYRLFESLQIKREGVKES